MNVAAALSMLASAIEFVIGALALAFARAPGWKHFRTFSVVAFSAAVVGAGNGLLAIGAVHSALTPWTGRLILCAACIHSAAWVAYARAQYGEPRRAVDRALIGLLISLGVLALVPGVLVRAGSELQEMAWAGVSYPIPVQTPLGSLTMLLAVLALLAPVHEYVRRARLGTHGARTHLIGFSILFGSAVNEVLVALRVFDGLYFLDVGFLTVVLSVLADMTYRVTGDARRLEALSLELSREVEERTRELTKARDELVHAERLAALGRLSASIGHEINNPLSYLLGNLQYCLRELDRRSGEESLVEALKDATMGAERIRRIIDELRAFSRGSDGDRRELVQLSDVIDATIKLVWGEIRHRARLTRNLNPTPQVFADPMRLTQVLVNLLLNAAQAIPEGVGRDRASIEIRSGRTSTGDAFVEIQDNGVGIPEADRRRLFEPFFSTKPQDKGNGLGLFVSLGIVSALGGSIEVTSRVGEGTTVRVSLPRARGLERPGRHVTSAPPPVKPCRLLIVDDDALVARTLARLLNRHQVEVITSSREALVWLKDHGHSIDLVFCDLMMPDLTGMELYEEIERLEPELAPRFLFISGGGITDRSRKFIEAHADRVLAKPIDTRQLSMVLAKHVEGAPLAPLASSANG